MRKSPVTNNFSIEKWYMDCIDSQGNTFIGYAAILQWGKLLLKYSSQLIYTNGNGVIEKSSLRKTTFPHQSNDLLNWQLPYAQTNAIWKSLNTEIETTLLDSEKGNIHWQCTQPKAIAEVSTMDNLLFKGLGYTEKLKLTIKPWELPINELRWGRFLSESHSIIWINWMGPHPLNILFVNGNQVYDMEITNFKIISKDEKLELNLHNSVTLREGSLITTALARFPFLKKIFPEKILITFECKWRSAGILKISEVETSPGWAIHEIVQWT